MRICLYSGTVLPKLGGQEAVVDALARQFVALGHQPFVVAPHPKPPIRADDASLPYPVLRHPRFFSTRRLVSWYRLWLLRFHQQYHFDVIHCHDTYPTAYLAALLRDRMRIPILITSHGGDVREGNTRLSKPGMRPRFELAVRSAEALISIGRFTERGFLQLGAEPKQIISIPNGVDLEPFRQPMARPPGLNVPQRYALFLGRLAKRKGIDTLLEAMGRLSEGQLVIAGSGEEQGAIQQQIDRLGLRDRVQMVGRVDGEAKTYLLQNAVCTVMPSRGWEAFPLVMLESYAAGRPVIASRIAGLEDLVQHEKTGLLFTEESSQELAAALQRMFGDENWAKSMSGAAKAAAADYGWPVIARRHLDLYQKLMDRRPARPQP
jgi:glycosyltransferase involved in cell wall biosynthesis